MSYGRIHRGPMAADAFTQIRNAVFRDPRLSAKAMGVFGHISTHRDGWGITPESMSNQMRDGVDSIKAGLRELERYGYLQRTRERRPDGTLGASVYFITDQPEAIAALVGEENPRSLPEGDFPPLAGPSQVEPSVGKPPVAEPTVVDPLHKKTNSKNPKGKKTLSPPAVPKPTPQPPAAPEDERENPAAPSNDNDTATVAAAWSTARGARRNPAAERDVATSAGQLLAAGWPLPDVMALAEDMARRQPTYRDLTRHADHWKPARVVAAVPSLPPWCGECDGEPLAERWISAGGGVMRCPACNPHAKAA